MEKEERINKLKEVRDEVMKKISESLKNNNARETLDWLAVFHEVNNRLDDE